MILSKLRQCLADKYKAIDNAEMTFKHGPTNPLGYLQEKLGNSEFVLFCGAGISIPAPACAPSFLELRTSVVLSLVDLLVERQLLSDKHRRPIEIAMEYLDTRVDLTLPPEHVFSRIEDSLGFDNVLHILASCLGSGKPNENHLAIRRLIRSSGLRLSSVITPNFDLYIEQALEDLPLRRTVGQETVGDGFRLFKPHGSLDCRDSISITIGRIIHPLKGAAREILRDLVIDRAIVVVGYSGWDYDLLPMLVHAGRMWGSKILWLLYDDASFNERTAFVQLTLGDRCTVINCQRQSLLAMLGRVEEQWPREEHVSLRKSFANLLRAEPSDALILALIDLLTPSGVQESAGVVGHLCGALLRMVQSGQIKDDERRLKCLGHVVAWSSGPAKLQAAGLAVECGKRLKRDLVVQSFERIIKENESGDLKDQLQEIDRDLREFPFSFKNDPEPERAEQSTRTDLRIRRASALMDLRRYAEAEALVREILTDTPFPESGAAESAWIVDDGSAIWKPHTILGSIAARACNFEEMQSYFCAAIDVLWREGNFWDLATALHQIAHIAARRDPPSAEAAMELSVRVARYIRDQLSELVAIERKGEYGFASTDDFERAEMLLKSVHLAAEDRKRHDQTIKRLKRIMGRN